ncbi:hypothetical protein MJI95_36985, partial [Salmonella enterica subsp. enterica serovar Kentucky]|nr:hypothetical protein [Salmonella enterica subsp. enterica serovar Kentucky]
MASPASVDNLFLQIWSDHDTACDDGLAGLICALPLFFEVAIVLLISVAFSMARHTGTNLVKLVIPL